MLDLPNLYSISLGEGVFKGKWDVSCSLVMESSIA